MFLRHLKKNTNTCTHLFRMEEPEDTFEVTVPVGHGEHWVHRLIEVSVASTSLLLDHIMTFQTAERMGWMYRATQGVMEYPLGVDGSTLHRQRDGC